MGDQTQGGLPDLDNIANVGASIQEQRLKQALRHFRTQEFDLEEALSTNGLAAEIGEGLCLSVALSWLRNHDGSSRASPAGPRGALMQRQVLDAIVQFQRAYEAQHQPRAGRSPEETVDIGIRDVLARSGINVANASRQIPFSGEALQRELLQSPGRRLFALTGFMGAGHAIVAYTPDPTAVDPRVQFFDPEAGEFKLRPEEIDYFFTALDARYRMVGMKYNVAQVYLLT